MAGRRSKFSTRERRAFNMGRGFAVAKKGKRVKGMNEREKRSFLNGMNSVRGR